MRSLANVFVLGLLVTGCRMGTLSQDELDRQYPIVRLSTLTGEGLDDSLAELRDAVGGKVRITSLSFTDQRTSFQAQNPRSPRDFDHYTYWQGDVHKSATTLSGDDEQRYTARLFDLDTVPFDKLGGFALIAVKALAMEGAHAQSLSVDMNDGQLEVYVPFESERRRGHVKLRTDGTVIEAKQD